MIYYPGMEFELPDIEARPADTNYIQNSARGGKMSITKVDDYKSFEDEVSSVEKVLVKFEADWCLPCRAMASVVEEIANQHPDIKVIAANVDGEGMEVALRKYGVKAVPTFVHLRRGSTVRSVCGTVSKAELTQLLRES